MPARSARGQSKRDVTFTYFLIYFDHRIHACRVDRDQLVFAPGPKKRAERYTEAKAMAEWRIAKD